MPALADTIEGTRVEARPWPRVVVSADVWRAAASRLAAGEWAVCRGDRVFEIEDQRIGAGFKTARELPLAVSRNKEK